MKKSFNLFSFAVLTMTVLVACSEQNLDNIATKDYFYNSHPAAASLVASTQSNVDAKSQLSSNGENPDVYWTEGDKVSVFQLQNQEYKNLAFTTATNKSTTASFTEDVTGSFDAQVETAAYAVYPYSASNAVTVVDETVTITAEIPAIQTATNNTFAEETNLAVGVLDAGNVAFKNVCAYMRFYVTNGGKVQSITITGKNDEYIAGKVNITFNDKGEPVATPIEGESSKSITLTCPEGQNGFTKGHTYYVAVLPGVFEEGVILTINTVQNVLSVGNTSLSNTTPIVRTSNDVTLTLTRNKVKRFPYWDDRIEWHSAMLFDFEKNTIDQFWTSSSNDLISSTGSESNCYKVVANPKTNTINPSEKVLMFDASLAGDDNKINAKQYYKNESSVENARFAFTPTKTGMWSGNFTGVRMKIYISEEDASRFFPRCQISYTKATISGTTTIINRPIMTPKYLNGTKLDVKWLSYVDNGKATTDLAAESIANIDATYNVIDQAWLNAWVAAIKVNDWNDFVFDYRSVTGSNIPAHSNSAYMCRIHPFFPAKIDPESKSDMYHADEYGRIYIDDIEYVEFYGAN